MSIRQAEISRTTKETEIYAKINLDGEGHYQIDTEIGFLTHMLEQLARHSLIDIELKASGDTHIDYHHQTEDSAIAFGQAFKKALGEKKGIIRYAHAYLPMDETLTRVAIDISGRPWLEWRVEFPRDKIGDMDTELFREWFAGFAFAAGVTLHIENLYGINSHHIAESCFKALAIALRKAVTIEPRMHGVIPSTKGVL